MPYKYNEDRRHKFEKARYRVENWREYNEALMCRGDITIWFSEAAINQWHPTPKEGQRGRPQHYSDQAIECCLMLRQVYKLPLRQTQGLLRSLINLMKLPITAPDYSLLSKRSLDLQLKRLADTLEPGSQIIIDSTGLKVYGKDEWHQEKHKVKAKRTWRKLHMAIDENHQIIAAELTDKHVGDTTALPALLEQLDDFDKLIADGAYDGDPIYEAILDKSPQAEIIIPPPNNAVKGSSKHQQRNNHTEFIEQHGRMGWQRHFDYGLQALAELAMLRYKTIIGPKLKARKLPQQKTEATISVRVLNHMTKLGMPISVKVA